MKFYIEKIILWLKNGNKRIISFKNNKVNVLTGNSKTGKTAVLEIIDYCLCGSESNISYKDIGENVRWYGLKFSINGKIYTIARGELKDENKLSKDYYFSSNGIIPGLPSATISEQHLKEIIEQEFSIKPEVTFAYGGSNIKNNSKISYRYFMMFNTLSGDIINHSKTYFDKLDIQRYREALPRIFDLALGFNSIDNLLLQDKIVQLEQKLRKYYKDKELLEKEIDDKELRLKSIIKKAKELKIISSKLTDYRQCIKEIQHILDTGNLTDIEVQENKEFEELKIKKQCLEIQINKLGRFKNRYLEYKKSLNEEIVALQPISYIKGTFSDNIINDEYNQFLNILENEFKKIKSTIKDKMPFEYGIDNKIKELKKDLSIVNENLKIVPYMDDSIISDKQRLISIGEMKTEFLNIMNQQDSSNEIESLIVDAEHELSELKGKDTFTEQSKISMIDALNDYIQTYIEIAKNALDEYGNYLASFDYNKKVLNLRKPKSALTANITSSSDHLFMHLCMFLGIHHLIINNQAPYVMPFLIIDQASRPYYNNKTFDFINSKEIISEKDDWNKVKEIFKLLNSFIDNINEEHSEFQIILLEHVSIDAWSGCKNVHLVETFDGEKNALIPPEIVK